MDGIAIKKFFLRPRGIVKTIQERRMEVEKKIDDLEATINGEDDWFTCNREVKYGRRKDD